jgi:PBP1b-binding outer membrane lipoprotein LpoB
MKKLKLMSLVASGMILLAGCGGGGSSGSSMGASPPASTAPIVPVAPTPQPPAEPAPMPVGKPDFTVYLSQLVASVESETPQATDDLEFVFADEDDDSVFATLLDM